jgi:hypothetical protein
VLRATFLAHPRQGSSAVEQGTHKPLVGSSILPPGIFLKWRGSIFFVVPTAGITLAQLLILMPVLHSIYVVILRRQSASETKSRLQRERKSQR